MTQMWMIRAGKGSESINDFLENSHVSIGFGIDRDISGVGERTELLRIVQEIFPEYKRGKALSAAGQLFRFVNEIEQGDEVVTYDSSRRVYHLGKIIGRYSHTPTGTGRPAHVRKVEWLAEIYKDVVSTPSNYTLGAIQTLFLLSEPVAEELRARAKGDVTIVPPERVVEEEEKELLEDFEDRSRELIKDRVSRLTWDEMQEVVAGLLRAMGYKTRVSPRGADRGKDIVASPDGFGFEQPRIVVEVKHRVREQISADQIRSFLGGRHKDDKGLYVSTGGFTKDSHYEAERASIPLTLMDLDQLVEGITANYDAMDSEVRALVPLRKVYWPL